MRRRFLTVYDYGQGGIWQYIHADRADQITAKYPALKIVEIEPAWLSAANAPRLREYDVEAEPDEILVEFTAE